MTFALFRGFSAGSFPKGEVHPLALEVIKANDLTTEGLRSKSWNEFAAPDSPAIDLVITDVKMPGGMDGFALADWIQSNRPGVEIILASADESSGERAKRSPQFGPFLAKPYTGRALLDLVKEALSKRPTDASGAA